jgi:hypothetical protein
MTTALVLFDLSRPASRSFRQSTTTYDSTRRIGAGLNRGATWWRRPASYLGYDPSEVRQAGGPVQSPYAKRISVRLTPQEVRYCKAAGIPLVEFAKGKSRSLIMFSDIYKRLPLRANYDSAFAVCDRCGFLYNREALAYQRDYVGARHRLSTY